MFSCFVGFPLFSSFSLFSITNHWCHCYNITWFRFFGEHQKTHFARMNYGGIWPNSFVICYNRRIPWKCISDLTKNYFVSFCCLPNWHMSVLQPSLSSSSPRFAVRRNHWHVWKQQFRRGGNKNLFHSITGNCQAIVQH